MHNKSFAFNYIILIEGGKFYDKRDFKRVGRH